MSDLNGGVVDALGRFWEVSGVSGGSFGDVLKPLGRFGGVLDGFWEPLRHVLERLGRPLAGSCRLFVEF